MVDLVVINLGSWNKTQAGNAYFFLSPVGSLLS